MASRYLRTRIPGYSIVSSHMTWSKASPHPTLGCRKPHPARPRLSMKAPRKRRLLMALTFIQVVFVRVFQLLRLVRIEKGRTSTRDCHAPPRGRRLAPTDRSPGSAADRAIPCRTEPAALVGWPRTLLRPARRCSVGIAICCDGSGPTRIYRAIAGSMVKPLAVGKKPL